METLVLTYLAAGGMIMAYAAWGAVQVRRLRRRLGKLNV
jgi:hypothetical protein